MSTAYKFGVLFGFIMVFLIIAIIATISRKSNAELEYDERQEIERGKAYKSGFITFLIVDAIIIFGKGLGINLSAYIDELSIYFIVMIIPFTVFAVAAVMHDALFAFNMEGRRAYIILYLTLFCNLVPAIMNIIDGKFFDENGVIQATGGFMNLTLAILFGIILVTHFIRKRLTPVEED